MQNCLVNRNLGKVNLETSLVDQQSSPRQAGLCRLVQVYKGFHVISM